jgi:hypothetical protein
MEKPQRLLVVSPTDLDGAALRKEIERRTGNRPAEVLMVAPAVTESKLKTAFGDVDDAIANAERRLADAIDDLRSERVAVSGAIGESDPLVAAEDALGAFPADEILIVTHRGDEAEWFEESLFERAAERFEPPVAHIELGEGNGSGQLAEVERSGAGISRDEPAEDELELSPNLPPFSRRDLLGILVAVVGTIVLALLAASADPDSGTGAARILIAIAFALLNLAHVVGLVLFNSQQYRGAGRNLFANLSLFGTPVAIVVSLLI